MLNATRTHIASIFNISKRNFKGCIIVMQYHEDVFRRLAISLENWEGLGHKGSSSSKVFMVNNIISLSVRII